MVIGFHCVYRCYVRVGQSVSLSIETEAEEGDGQTQKAEEEGDLRWMKRDIVPQVHPRLAGTHHWVRAGGGRALSGNRDSKAGK